MRWGTPPLEIDRFKSKVREGAMLGSCSLRILADMLLGPVDLLVSSWSRSSSISSSVHRRSAGISSGSSSFAVQG